MQPSSTEYYMQYIFLMTNALNVSLLQNKSHVNQEQWQSHTIALCFTSLVT